MKKIITILLLLIPVLTFSQTEYLEYKGFILLKTTVTKEQTYTKLKYWVSENFAKDSVNYVDCTVSIKSKYHHDDIEKKSKWSSGHIYYDLYISVNDDGYTYQFNNFVHKGQNEKWSYGMIDYGTGSSKWFYPLGRIKSTVTTSTLYLLSNLNSALNK